MNSIFKTFLLVAVSLSLLSSNSFAQNRESEINYDFSAVKADVGKVIEQALTLGAYAHEIKYFGIVHFEPFGSGSRIYSEPFAIGPKQEATEILREAESQEGIGVLEEVDVEGDKWLKVVDIEGNAGYIAKAAVKKVIEVHPALAGQDGEEIVYEFANLRSEARIQYPIVTKAEKGSPLVVLYEVQNDLGQEWLRVETQDGVRAWILKQLTRSYMEIPEPKEQLDWGPSKSWEEFR